MWLSDGFLLVFLFFVVLCGIYCLHCVVYSWFVCVFEWEGGLLFFGDLSIFICVESLTVSGVFIMGAHAWDFCILN